MGLGEPPSARVSRPKLLRGEPLQWKGLSCPKVYAVERMTTTPKIDKDYKKGGSEVRNEATKRGGQVGREKGGLRSEYKGRRVHGEIQSSSDGL